MTRITTGARLSAQPTDLSAAEATFSPDGQYWWDGQICFPAVSADRKWRFDGTSWVPVRRYQPLPTRLVCFGAVWLVALAGWLVAGIGFLVAEAPNHSTGNELPVIGSLAGVAVLATIAWGFLLGRGRRSVWVSPSAVAGATVEMFLYVAAMIAVPSPSGDDQDTAAGAGIVILGIPTALAILALLWLGAGIGIASRSRVAP